MKNNNDAYYKSEYCSIPQLLDQNTNHLERLWHDTPYYHNDSLVRLQMSNTYDRFTDLKCLNISNQISSYDIDRNYVATDESIERTQSTSHLSTDSSNFSSLACFFSSEIQHQQSKVSLDEFPYQYSLSQNYSNPLNHSLNDSLTYVQYRPSDDEYIEPMTYEIFMKLQQQEEEQALKEKNSFRSIRDNEMLSSKLEINTNNNIDIVKEELIEYKCDVQAIPSLKLSLPSPYSILSFTVESQPTPVMQAQSPSSPTQSFEISKRKRSKISETERKPSLNKTPQNKTIYKCLYYGCTKSYSNRSLLRSHERTHPGVKPYQCTWPDCEWKCGRSDELTRHLRKHAGVKSFACKQCDRAFSRSDHLSQHLKHYPTGSDVTLKNCNGGTIAKISSAYWQALKMECSGRLSNGEHVNGGNSDCSCFMKVAEPLGSKSNKLEPYVSIAANDIQFGTKVYIHQLNCVSLPTGRIRNGRVRVDDVSWSFGANHIDFYVLRKTNYEEISGNIHGQADITVNSNCVLNTY
ncbi:unnamed protein product [Rotaria magnacalcarata]|uniref:C2H2-type domain-containing protein n=1 Tax=Rotaria magnacalcarata TaxID=392030 RepID=A0A816ULJ3_9BILA|nr:unnamed protein product [Rotaria magnacalcarata]